MKSKDEIVSESDVLQIDIEGKNVRFTKMGEMLIQGRKVKIISPQNVQKLRTILKLILREITNYEKNTHEK